LFVASTEIINRENEEKEARGEGRIGQKKEVNW
jgi:hypothetical protein